MYIKSNAAPENESQYDPRSKKLREKFLHRTKKIETSIETHKN